MTGRGLLLPSREEIDDGGRRTESHNCGGQMGTARTGRTAADPDVQGLQLPSRDRIDDGTEKTTS